MLPSNDVKTLGSIWTQNLRDDELASRVVETLTRESEGLAIPFLNQVREGDAVLNTVVAADLDQTRFYVMQHFRTLLWLPTGRASELGGDPLAFVREHGIRRARANVPLKNVLKGFRLGHKSFWAAICGVIGRLARNADEGLRTTTLLSDYCIDYTDLISSVVSPIADMPAPNQPPEQQSRWS